MGQILSKKKPPQMLIPLPKEPTFWRVVQDYTREEEWSKQLEEIKNFDLQNQLKYLNVLLLGQVSSGKSSFFNNVDSIFQGFVSSKADAGFDKGSLTVLYKKYELTDKEDKKLLKFRFCDTMGLEDNKGGLRMEAVIKALDGGMPQGANFQEFDQNCKDEPTKIEDKIHCVCFVIDSTTFSSMHQNMIEHWKKIRVHCRDRGMTPIVILTHVDKLCEETGKDLHHVFKSEKIGSKVEEISNKLGIAAKQMCPVVNYTTQQENDRMIDSLTFRALVQIKRWGTQYLQMAPNPDQNLALLD